MWLVYRCVWVVGVLTVDVVVVVVVEPFDVGPCGDVSVYCVFVLRVFV